MDRLGGAGKHWGYHAREGSGADCFGTGHSHLMAWSRDHSVWFSLYPPKLLMFQAGGGILALLFQDRVSSRRGWVVNENPGPYITFVSSLQKPNETKQIALICKSFQSALPFFLQLPLPVLRRCLNQWDTLKTSVWLLNLEFDFWYVNNGEIFRIHALGFY